MANGEQVIINRRNFLKLGTAIVGGASVYKLFKNDVDRILYNLFYGEPQPYKPTPVVNETAKPTATPAPKYDYYDEELKAGVEYIEPSIKTNVTNLIRTWKETTPDDYADLIKYAPKKIVKSNDDNFNWYGGSNDDDFISLAEAVELRGGSDDLKTRLVGVVDMEPEFGNAKRSKTGVKFSSGYDSELDVAIRKAKYAVRVGVWTQKRADRYVEQISERLKAGTYYDGAK